MLSPATIFRYKLALIRDAELHNYLVKGTRAYTIRDGKTVAILLLGSYARATLREFQKRHNLPITGILDAATREALIPTGVPAGVRGVDISNHQPDVDITRLKSYGFRFAFAKVTEGHTYVDPLYVPDRAACKAAGIVAGGYHFARPTVVVGDGASQAKFFLGTAKPAKGDLFPALDLEVADGVPPAALIQWTRDFVNVVKAQCGGCFLYTYPAFWDDDMMNSGLFKDCPLWLASYTGGVNNPGPAPHVPAGLPAPTIWQYSSKSSLTGEPNLDLNISVKSLANCVIK